MKIDHLIAAMAFVALAVSPALAQQRPAAPSPAPAQTTAVPDGKIAIIYSEAFGDAKTGIAKFSNVMATLNREFQPRQTELNGLVQQIQTLETDIKNTQSVADPKALQTKIDTLEAKKKEYQRKGEDAEAAYKKRREEVFMPLQDDISRALEAYAKQRGITVIIDRSQVPVVYAADSIDITRGFIIEFNAKNPATAAVSTPK
jgi:outer membrane protein